MTISTNSSNNVNKTPFTGIKPAATGVAGSTTPTTTAPGASYGTDNLVRTSQVAAVGSQAADATRTAELRLGNAAAAAFDAATGTYDADKFSLALASSSLESMVSELA